MSKLRREDWLPIAQRTPVGGSTRARHKCPGRVRSTNATNMTVKNLPDRYTAYCHSGCGGGVVLKTHVRIAPAPDQERFMPWPGDECGWTASPHHEALRALLADKGMHPEIMCPDQVIWYSQKQRRLLFGTSLGWIGRATAGQAPKWTGYGYPAPAYHKHPSDPWRSVWVLTEDYLSALKVRWACPGVTAIGLCGTNLPKALAVELVTHKPDLVLTFLDGDKAGRAGVERVVHRVQGLGFTVRDVPTPTGCDPKDLFKHELQELIYGQVNPVRRVQEVEPRDAALGVLPPVEGHDGPVLD